MAYSKAACTLVCANEPDWQNERRMIRCGYCNECTPQIVQAACQCPKSSLHPRMFALNGGLESNPTIYLPFQSVKLKPSAGCFLCVMRQTVAQQPLTPSPVGEGWGEGFGVGMAAIRHVLPLSFLFAFGIFPLCGRVNRVSAAALCKQA